MINYTAYDKQEGLVIEYRDVPWRDYYTASMREDFAEYFVSQVVVSVRQNEEDIDINHCSLRTFNKIRQAVEQGFAGN